jgi:integrase
VPRKEIKPHEIRHHGNTRWRVLVPAALRGSGPAKRIFPTRAKALAFANEINAGRQGWSGRLLAFSDEDQGRLVRAVELAGSIEALERAAEQCAKARVATAKPLADAVKECVAAKESAGRSWQYVENLGVALRQFSAGRETRAVSEITSAEVDAWLNGNAWSPSTKITYLRRLETFFSWCAKRGYSALDPTAAVERPTESHSPVVVLSPRDCRRLLESARRVDPGLLPYFAIGLFAGIRPDEIKRLQAGNIKGEWIHIEAAKSKTRRRRLVEIHPTLRAWLSLGGEIGWRNWRCRWLTVRKATSVGEHGPERPIDWVSDIMRHSFCSYAYPVHGAAWTSMHAGHSEQTLFRHYRELVTRETAEQFWSILP